MKRLTPALAVAALAVVPLSACGSSSASSSASTATSVGTMSSTTASASGASSSSAGDTTSATTTSSTSASTASGSASSITPTLPEGNKLVTVSEAKVRYAVPKAWVQLDASALDTAEVRKLIAPLARANGVSVDAYVKNMTRSSALYMISPIEDGAGVHDNVNAGRVIDSSDVDRGADAMKQAMTSQGARVTGQSRVQTSLGEGSSTTYSLSIGGHTVQGDLLLLPTPQHQMVPLAVTAGTASEASGFAATVVRSYRAA